MAKKHGVDRVIAQGRMDECRSRTCGEQKRSNPHRETTGANTMHLNTALQVAAALNQLAEKLEKRTEDFDTLGKLNPEAVEYFKKLVVIDRQGAIDVRKMAKDVIGAAREQTPCE
jgi:hypothetical protein